MEKVKIEIERKKTKLERILEKKELSQGDLIRLIYKNSGFKIGRDRISRICTGTIKNFNIETGVMISEALGVTIDKIVEMKKVKKVNPVKKSKKRKSM
jgi:hypothetical protein